MSDLCIYEFGDVILNDFESTSDDHLVPGSTDEGLNRAAFLGDRYMKNWDEASVFSGNARDILAVKSTNQKSSIKNMQILNNIKGSLLERNSWSDAPDCNFALSHGSNSTIEMTSLVSADDHNSYGYPLGDISQTGEPSFFVTNQTYGWSDLGDFEDIDGMFSNGSSTFGIGDICEEEELSCFLSSHDIEGFEAVSRSAFKFPSSDSSPFASVLGHCENPTPISTVNDSNADKGSFHFIPSSHLSDCTVPTNVGGNLMFMDGIETTSRNKNGFNSNDQNQIEMEQLMHQDQSSKRKREDFCSENGNEPDHTGTSQSRTDSYDYSQNHLLFKDPYRAHDHSDLFSKTVMPSSANLENNGLASFSAKESSCLTDQVKPSDSSYQLSFEAPYEKIVSLPEGHGHHFSCRSDTTYMNIQEQSTQQSLLHEEASNRGSGLDEISFEASSFQMLQQMMEKLDGRTKLSLRDGLYRLARSAEKRHKHATLNDSSDDIDVASGSLMTEGKSNGFANKEAGTNPIDRSIAHLLFYKQCDDLPSPMLDLPSNDRLTFPPTLLSAVCE